MTRNEYKNVKVGDKVVVNKRYVGRLVGKVGVITELVSHNELRVRLVGNKTDSLWSFVLLDIYNKNTAPAKHDQIDKLEKQLARLCDKLYDLAVDGRRLIPKHPYILVRVLPKEHVTPGGIILAENDQNKPMYEGIVVAIWQPYDEIREKEKHDEQGMICERVIIHHECDVKVGERVCFPHYEGLSMHGYLDEKYYRMIREGTDQNRYPYCSVVGKIDFHGDAEAAKKIRKLTSDIYSITTSGVAMSRGDTPRIVN